MFLSDMERKTLAITPPLLLSILFFHLRGAFGSSKAFHYLLLLSCLLLSSVNTLHNLAEYDDSCGSHGYNSAAWFHDFNGGDSSVTVVAQQSGSSISQFFCFLSSENKSDSVVPFGFPGFNKSWSGSGLISNNLSDVEWLFRKGYGKSMSLILYDDSKLVHFIEFQPLLGHLHISPPFTGILYIGDTTFYKPLLQELHAKTTGELSISVSCGENGFMVQKCCEGLEPGESMEFILSYQTKPSTSVMFRDLGLSSTSGVLLAVPMKATLPVLILNLCKKTVFWVRTKKSFMAILLAAAAVLLLIFSLISPQLTVIVSNDHFNEMKKRSYSHIEIKSVEKSSNNVQENCNITISPEMDSLLRSISEETLQEFNNSKDNSSSRTSITRTPITSVPSQEASKAVNLTVKTAKDKKRRRKKKKKGAVGGLTPERSIEASSSHSGDSTPTSPLSPLTSLPSEQPTRSSPLQEANKPAKSRRSVLSHSATFPGPEVKLQRSERSSSLAPNVRAPGGKVCDEEEIKKSRKEVKEEKIKEYNKYDIWGDHLTGLNLMGRFKDVRAGKSSGLGEDEYESFFVKGSPTFLADSHARFVSFYNQWG